MRKLLLFICASVISMTAAAQNAFTDQTKGLVYAKAPVVAKVKVIGSVDNVSVKDMSAIRAQMAQAPAQGDLYGTYIEDNSDEIHECSSAELKEKTVDGVTYVNMIFGDGYVDVIGTYDPATSKISVEPQVCGSYTGYGNFTLFGLGEGDQPGYVKVDTKNPLTFTVEENGTISLDQYGWCAYMLEYEQPGFWNLGLNTNFFKPNAVHAGERRCSESNWQYAAFTDKVYAEDMDFAVNVYGFGGPSGRGCLAIDVNEDGTVAAATGQVIAYLHLRNQEDINTYGTNYYFNGYGEDGYPNHVEKEFVYGTISGNKITFTEGFAICSLLDADGAAYQIGGFRENSTITLDNGNYIGAGIKEIGATMEEKAKNAKTYNILGQQVNRANAKGLLIRNGKKFIK